MCENGDDDHGGREWECQTRCLNIMAIRVDQGAISHSHLQASSDILEFSDETQMNILRGVRRQVSEALP
jgi:hypothetical protein